MKKARAMVALAVAFGLGLGAGGLVEHQRLKHTSNKKASASTTVATTGAAAPWFTSPVTAACPGLKEWNATAVAAYTGLLQTAPWTTTRAALSAQSTASTGALKRLLPFATTNGKTRLNLLITHESEIRAALQRATSVATYLKATTTLTTPNIRSVDVAMQRFGATCTKT